MPDSREIRYIGAELQENNALVYADTKLQTLDRRVGKDNLYFGKELFEKSLNDWEGTPVIYQKDGIHPDDFALVGSNPEEAAKNIGGKLVGRVHDPRIVVEGGARLMATLAINEDEEEISSLWKEGKLFPSTAFTTHSNGDKITTPPVPNHVLLFPMQVDKVVPGDPGAFVNTERNVKTMEPEKVENTDVTDSAKDEEIKNLNTELAELRNALKDFESLKAELEQYKKAEKEAKFARLLRDLPVGMTQTEEQRRKVKELFETNPTELLFTVLETQNTKMTTEKSGVPYTFSENIADIPLTTVGNLSGRL